MEMKTRNTRIDVQTKINRIIELMQRPQGASVKEICAELECAEKTFYRHLEKLAVQNVPYITRPDPDGKTNSVRYYIIKSAIKGSNVFLSASEKALLRMVLQNSKPQIEAQKENKKLAETLLEKINDGVIHDTRESEIKLISDSFLPENKWDYDENFILLSEALELKQGVTFKTIHNPDYGERENIPENPLENKSLKQLGYELKFSELEDVTIFQTYSIINKDGDFWALGKVIPKTPSDALKLPVEIRRVKIQELKDIKLYKNYSYAIPSDYDFDYWYKFYWGIRDKKIIHLAMDKSCAYFLWNETAFEPKASYIYGGKIHVMIETNDFYGIERYVLGLGPDVQVVSPKSFADIIKSSAEKIIKNYECSVPKDFSEMQEVKIQLESIDSGTHPRLLSSNFYSTCWRYDLKPVSRSIFCFDVSGFKKIFAVVKNYKSTSFYNHEFKNRNLDQPFSTIYYEDRIVYEVAFPDAIDGNLDFYFPVLKNLCSQNLVDGFEQKILEDNRIDEKAKKEILKRKEKYSQNKPMLLLTGLNRIKPEWKEEILQKGTFFGIPARAVLIQEDCSKNGELIIKAYKY